MLSSTSTAAQSYIGQSIKLVLDPEGRKNVCLVELQGKIEYNNSKNTTTNDPLTMAVIDLSTPDEPVLLIGNQRLVGRKVLLKKPLALLSTNLSDTTSFSTNNDDGNSSNNRNGLISHREMKVSSIVYEKYLFDSRPQTKHPSM